MYSDPNTPRIRPKGIVRILDDADVIEASDLVRDTSYSSHMECVDYGQIRDMDWLLASDAVSGWVGKTIREMRKFNPSVLNDLEIIRAVS